MGRRLVRLTPAVRLETVIESKNALQRAVDSVLTPETKVGPTGVELLDAAMRNPKHTTVCGRAAHHSEHTAPAPPGAARVACAPRWKSGGRRVSGREAREVTTGVAAWGRARACASESRARGLRVCAAGRRAPHRTAWPWVPGPATSAPLSTARTLPRRALEAWSITGTWRQRAAVGACVRDRVAASAPGLGVRAGAGLRPFVGRVRVEAVLGGSARSGAPRVRGGPPRVSRGERGGKGASGRLAFGP